MGFAFCEIFAIDSTNHYRQTDYLNNPIIFHSYLSKEKMLLAKSLNSIFAFAIHYH